jgi:hypothetical protein
VNKERLHELEGSLVCPGRRISTREKSRAGKKNSQVLFHQELPEVRGVKKSSSEKRKLTRKNCAEKSKKIIFKNKNLPFFFQPEIFPKRKKNTG